MVKIDRLTSRCSTSPRTGRATRELSPRARARLAQQRQLVRMLSRSAIAMRVRGAAEGDEKPHDGPPAPDEGRKSREQGDRRAQVGEGLAGRTGHAGPPLAARPKRAQLGPRLRARSSCHSRRRSSAGATRARHRRRCASFASGAHFSQLRRRSIAAPMARGRTETFQRALRLRRRSSTRSHVPIATRTGLHAHG
jgi:hypothetical protein